MAEAGLPLLTLHRFHGDTSARERHMKKVSNHNPIPTKKLQLHRETLRMLHTPDLHQICGREAPPTERPILSHDFEFHPTGKFGLLAC